MPASADAISVVRASRGSGSPARFRGGRIARILSWGAAVAVVGAISLLWIPRASSLVCPPGAVTWAGTASGNWNVAANWEDGVGANRVPGASDDACIETGLGITVTVSDAQAAQSLVASDNLSITSGGTLTLTNASEVGGDLTLAADLVAGADLTLAGTTTWSSGRLDGSVTTTGTLTLSTGSTKTLGGSLTNGGSGTVVHADGWLSLDAATSASVTNNGMWDFTGDFDSVTKSGAGADPVFTNNGTVRKSGGTFTTNIGSSIDVVNTGTFEATAGTLDVDDIVSSTGTTFVLANGAAILWNGDFTEVGDISGTFSATGLGTVQWTGEWAAASPVVLDFPAGVFTLAGDLDASVNGLTNDGGVSWQSGRIDGSFTNTDTLILSTLSTKTLGGSLTNAAAATVTHEEGWLSLDSDVGTSVTNNGLWDFTGDFDPVNKSGAGADPLFTNNGTVRKSGGTFTTNIGSLIDVTNTGTFEATSGTLDVDDIVSSTGTTFVLANDAVILWDGDFTEIADISGTFTGSGTGTVRWTGDWAAASPVTFDFPAGVFTFSGDLDAAATTLVNDGEVTWESGRIDGAVTNNDTLILSTFGTKTLGGSFTNAATATVLHEEGWLSLDSDVGTSVTNNGLWDFTGDFDDVNKSGAGADPSFTNNGTVRKSGGTFTTNIGSLIDVTNTGTFEATAGTLDVDDVVSSTGTTFVLANDAVILWDGDFTEIADISGTFSATGSGTVEWTGDWAAAAPVTFDFATGVFTFSGDLDAAATTVVNDGEVTWESGRIDGAVTNNDTLILTTFGTKTLGGSLTNAATATVLHEEGWLSLDSDVGTSVTNNGLWDFTGDFDDVAGLGSGSDPSFTNNGTVRKSAGTFTTSIWSTVAFTNPGVVEALSGNLEIDRTDLPQLPATTLTGGTWRVGADATLGLSSSASIDEIGTGATVELLGPNAVFSPLVDVTANSGSWTITGGATFTTAGALTTTGDLFVGPASTLTVAGDFTENSANSLHIQIADESSTGQFGVVDVTGFQANLLGVLDIDLVGGFTPVTGDAYDIIFWSTSSGTFSEIRDLDPYFQANFLADRLRLNQATNDPPVLDPIGNQSGDEGTTITFTATATDPNGDGLTYSLQGTPPAGASIDPATGVFTWITDEDDGPGSYPITVRVTDNGTPPMFDEEPLTVTVNEVNLAPTLGALTDQTVDEGSFVTFTATATDPDIPANTLTFSLPTPPPGAFIWSSTGLFTWTPQDSDDGGAITIQVDDDGTPILSDSADVSITVNNVAPTVFAGADQSVKVGETVSLDPATYSDPGSGDTHTATIDWGDGTVEPGVVDDPTNTVAGSHAYSSVGTFTVTVTVTDDDGGTGSDTLTVTVVDNLVPVAEAGGPYVTAEGTTIQLDGTESTDPDGAITSYAWSPDAGLDDATLAQPTYTAADDAFFTITLIVTDDGTPGLTDDDTATITVTNVAPVVTAGADQTADEGDTVVMDPATFTDAGTLDTHTASINWGDGTVTAGTVDQLAGTVSGSHVFGNDGVFTVTVTVTDDDGGSGSDTFTVTVGNVAPVLDAGPDQTADEGDLVVLAPATFVDPGTTETHTATVDWGDGTIDTGTVNQTADTIAASHEYTDNGTFTVTITVDDGGGGVDTDTFTATVDNVAPAVQAGADQTVLITDTVSLDPATFSDAGSADTHTATIDWGNGTVEPGTLDQLAGTIDGSHDYTTDGVFTVTVTVTDDDGGVGSDTLTVTVDLAPNERPTADAGGPYSVDEGSSVQLDGTGSSDSDGTIASYLWSPDTNLDDATLAQPTFSGVDDDVVTMTLEVTDDDGATSDPDATTTVTVNNVAPTVDAGLDQSTTVGTSISLDPATFTDPGTLDTHTATIDWGDGSVEPGTVGTGTVAGSHSYTATGTFTVTVTVTDDDGGVGSDTLQVTVTAVNLPPDAVDDEFDYPEGEGAHTLDVLGNDSDPENDALTIVANTDPATGTGAVTCGPADCTYTAPVGFSGVATFDYTISDGAGEDTATVTVNVLSCVDPTPAFADSGLVTGYAWVECADTRAHEVAGADLTPLFPPNGTLLHMTNGISGDGVPGDTANHDLGTRYRGAFDVSVLRLDLDIPEGATCLAVDVLFASEEYPDFVNKPYNDGFLAELGTSNWSVSGATIDAPNNFATDNDDYISVKGSFFEPGRVITATGMAYNGSTAVLRAYTPITPGAHSLFLSVFDGADGFENSAALVDNLVAFASPVCVPGLSQPPVAVDDEFTIDEDTSTQLEVILNDSDPDGDAITVLTISDPANGTVFATADRTAITYIPNFNFHGTDTFEYTLTDIPNSSEEQPIADVSRATVTVTVNEVNDPPIALPDGATVPVNTPTVIDVLANDFDYDAVDGDVLRISSATDPVFGSVACSATQCTFTPQPGYDGPDRFQYTVIDERAGVPRGGSDTVTVYINSTVVIGDTNVAPVADAGGPYEAEVDTPVLLDGSASFDPDGTIATWQWFTLTDAPVTINGADGPTPEFITPQNGVFRVYLIVTDNEGAWDWDTALITSFAAEVASPIDEGGSTAATVDFFNPGGDLITTFDWGDGSPLETVNFSIFPVSKTHDYPQDGNFDVTVCVAGDTAEEQIDVCDTQQLVVDNVLPDVNAGIDRSLVVGGTLIQSRMSFFDPGDDAPWTATVDWGDGSPLDTTSISVNQTTGVLTMTSGHVYPNVGLYTVAVCVQDDDAEGCDSFDVNVSNNVSPVANAGGPYSGDEGADIVLDGSASSDSDGTVDTFIWAASDPRVTLTGEDTATPTFVATDNGTYEVTLQVCDNEGACSALAAATVTVANVAPSVDAGVDQSALVGDTVSLDPATFTDPGAADTHTATVDWGDGTVDTGTVGAGTVDASHVYTAEGVHTVTVTVTDDDGGVGSDTFTVTVTLVPNEPPTADPGGPYTVDEGSSVQLDGTGSSDPDGTIESYLWSPDTNLDDATLAQPTFTGVDDDVVTLTLEVTDDAGASDSADTTVTVDNVAPTVDAGVDQTVNDGDTVNLDPATFTDPGTLDTHTAEVDWGDGTVEAGTVGAGTVDASHVYAAEGTYTVTVTVTDDDGGVGSDTFTVTVGGGACVPVYHELVTGDPAVDDGALVVGVDAIGAFGTAETGGGAVWNPLGPTEPATTVFSSNLYVSHLGALLRDCGFGDPVVVSASPTELVTSAGLGDLLFEVTQTVAATAEGAELTQVYRITNQSADPISSSLVRHLDGDLYFDGTLIDGGAASSDGSALYEFDSSDDPNDPSTYVGISGGLDGVPVPDRWTVQPYNYRPTLTANGGIPSADNGVVVNDDDGDRIVDTPYDVTVTQHWDATIGPGQTVEFTTVTTFGEQTPNVPPVADAGGPYSLDEGSSVQLDGTGSSDSDGTIASYLWSPDTNLDDATLAQPTFTGVDDDVVTMTLEVTDDNGATDSAETTVTVDNVAPAVDAGADQTVDEGDTVSLDPATFTDPGILDTHTATIDWGDGTEDDGTVGAGTVDGSHVYADDGVYTVTVTVTDDDGGVGSDSFTVTVDNVPPAVEAGADQTADEGDTVSLDPATFTDPGTADTHTAEVDWGDGTVEPATVGAGTVDGSHTYATAGTYTVTVTVTDDDGGVGSDTLTVTVTGTPNTPPVSDPGGPYSVDEGSTVQLDGAGSSDSDGTIESYLWSPDTNLDDATLAQPNFTGVDDDLVTMTLEVTDDHGATDSADTTVTVDNVAPAVDAGVDQSIGVGATVSLDPATFTDPGTLDTHTAEVDWGDGTVEPGTVGAGTVDGSHTYPTAGTYTVTVTVTDDDGGVGSGTFEVTVSGTPNEAPVAVNDQTVTRQNTLVVIDVLGNDTDADGDALTVTNLSDPANGSATVNPDGTVSYTPDTGFVGTDTFTYTANDGVADSAAATVTVFVIPPNKLLASDGATNDLFGQSVAIDGDRIAVGARDDDFGPDSGAVYVFEPDGSGGWTETKLVASDASTSDQFGASVALSGDRIVVGAYNADGPGAVYLFEADGAGGWIESKISPSDGALSDQFGFSVAVSDDRIVVGARLDDDNGSNSGSAYLFEADGVGDWTETKLVASDGAASDDFGRSVAVSGDRIVVGAYADDDLGSASGSVYVYEPDGAGGWSETKLTASDGASLDFFGYSVAVSGDRIVVGAYGDDDKGSMSGSAYIYEADGVGGWSESKLVASDGAANDDFGFSVSTAGDRILVGSIFDDPSGLDSGAAYAYQPDGASGWLEKKLTAADGTAGDYFGGAVAISGDRAVVGALQDDDRGTASGSAYVFDLDPVVTNAPPTADAGGPYTVDEGSAAQLDGSGSSDSDGSIVSYLWSPAEHLDDPTLAQPTFIGVDDAEVTMTLTVTDDDGTTATATTTVTVNNVAPTVDAGADQTVNDGVTVTLAPATFTDPGTADTHTASIDWGDGTVEAGTVGTGTVDGSHVYAAPGSYTVKVTVTDDDGGAGSDTFTVTVLDVTPPVLTVPAGISVEAAEPDGAIVTFVATATDNADPAPVVACAPASGSLFPIGDTLVTCTASDAAGNTATASFTVNVFVGSSTFDGFSDEIAQLNLPRGNTQALTAKIKAAQSALAAGDVQGAIDSLNALINQVNALGGRRLTTAQANAIRTAAQTLINALTASP